MRWWLVWAFCLASCSQIEREREAVVEQSKAVFLKVLDNANLTQTSLSANGKVINPEYVYTWVGGTGIFSMGTVKANGVELSGNVSGSGTGQAVPDADLRQRIDDILSRKDIAEIDRKQSVMDTITAWLKSKTAATKPAP